MKLSARMQILIDANGLAGKEMVRSWRAKVIKLEYDSERIAELLHHAMELEAENERLNKELKLIKDRDAYKSYVQSTLCD